MKDPIEAVKEILDKYEHGFGDFLPDDVAEASTEEFSRLKREWKAEIARQIVQALTPQPDEGLLLSDEAIEELTDEIATVMESIIHTAKAQLAYCQPIIEARERERSMQEVVDWVMKQHKNWNYGEHYTVYDSNLQAKLKEWGLKGSKK